MSSTTTTATISASSEAARLRNWNHLTDYELHHSNTPNTSRPNGNVTGSQAQHTAPSNPQHESQNPPDWPDNHRRIPPYRPINTELDQSQRRIYTSLGERAFLTVMFAGVQTNANLCWAWNATLGTFNDDWFKYKIGGEW